MTYKQKEFICGMVREIIKFHSHNASGRNTVRAPKTEMTTEAQKKINERNSIANLRRKINTNFGHNDLWLSFTYNKNITGELSPDAAKEVFEKKFLKNLRRAYKHVGQELKYIHILEVGKKGSPHHHMVCNHIDPRIIAELWKYGYVDIKYLDNSGQYKKIAAYMVKYTADNYDDPDKEFCKRRFNSSRNLKQPIIKTKIIKADGWRKEPTAKKGYQVTECYSGVSDVTGYPFQFYTMVAIPLERGYSLPEEMKKPKVKRTRGKYVKKKKLSEEDLFTEAGR